MTPPPSTPRPADRAGARHRARQVLTRAYTLRRGMTGELAYDRYLERYAREHTQRPHGHGDAHGSEHGSGHDPMSEREFWCAWAKQAETEINVSCCRAGTRSCALMCSDHYRPPSGVPEGRAVAS